MVTRSTRSSARQKKAARLSERTEALQQSVAELNLDSMEVEDVEDVEIEEPEESNKLCAVDLRDKDDPQLVVEYVHEIMAYLKSMEARFHPKASYMSKQRDINSRMREILIDWLNEVHLKFKLRIETLYLTVNLIDRFLSIRAVSRTKLQLVGCTAMLIASKYEEIYAPEVKDFVYISDRAYTREQILAMESAMLSALKFDLTVAYPLRFLERTIRLVDQDSKFNNLCNYLCELTLQKITFLNFLPSMVAASATSLALSMIDMPCWSNLLTKETGYCMEDLYTCKSAILKLLLDQSPKYAAVRKKYSHEKFGEVARIAKSKGPLITV